MPDFSAPENLTIQFAHSAYRLADTFADRRPEIATFQTWSVEETRARLGEADVLVLSGFWSNDMLDAATRLGFIQICAVGYDQFDQAALSARGIRLANAAGVNANAVAEHALALMLGLTRLLPQSRDNQRQRHWRPMIGDLGAREDELMGKTILIYGAGTIGRRVAALARAFGMTVLAVKRDTSVELPEVDELHAPVAFLSQLPRTDMVVLTCPLTEETRGLMDARAFAAMKPGARLINVARGGCVVEADLVAALTAGTLAGAGIDVTEPEPLPAASPLWDLDNVLLTPHSAGETRAYETRVIDTLCENLDRLARGETALKNQIV